MSNYVFLMINQVSGLISDKHSHRPQPINYSFITISQFNLIFLSSSYAQTLNTISAEKNSTIVFPLPIDILSYFMKTKEAVGGI